MLQEQRVWQVLVAAGVGGENCALFALTFAFGSLPNRAVLGTGRCCQVTQREGQQHGVCARAVTLPHPQGTAS